MLKYIFPLTFSLVSNGFRQLFLNLIYLKGNDVVDVEQCTYALTLVNKTLYEIDDQATFYDQSDFMEDVGIDKVTKLTSDDVPSTLLEEIQLVMIMLYMYHFRKES